MQCKAINWKNCRETDFVENLTEQIWDQANLYQIYNLASQQLLLEMLGF